jgi:hypothetical protein
MKDEAKEVRVFVRSGIPWIDSVCPTCGISKPVDTRPIQEQLQELSEKYSPAKAKEEYTK